MSSRRMHLGVNRFLVLECAGCFLMALPSQIRIVLKFIHSLFEAHFGF
jgi:hypothetical protein